MSTESPTGTDAAVLKHPWSGSVKLGRVPVCPTCAAPIHPSAFWVVAGVVFCRLCAAREFFVCYKESQIIRTPAFAGHTYTTAGLLFYQPRVHTFRSLREFAKELDIEYLWSVFPLTPSGEHIGYGPITAHVRQQSDALAEPQP